ncbi:hypothetical protein F4804DRAFT_353637 [Jackrogersella minutella]|nr:hypothetical protein F4804DRAFT_353637 [Jackrogersella minutella]
MNENNSLSAEDLGLKDIHLACLEGNLEMVVKLASQPGTINELTEPPNGTDQRLRETPINLAALMGHLDIVEFLIEQGAHLANDGFHASSYAGEKGRAARRRDFFLKTVGIGREHPDAVDTRKVIYNILVSPGRRSVISAMRGPRAGIGFPDYKLAKQGRDMVVYAPVLRIRSDIQLDRSKTVGVITAKGTAGAVLKAAHSGYKAGGERDALFLDTNRWSYIALHQVAALLEFQFPTNRHDDGGKQAEDEHRGRAHAGHVEVLLAVWYAVEMTRRSTGHKNAGAEWLLTRLHTLKRATLGQARSAVIMIDSQPCATCLRFINHLFRYTGLHFSVKGGVGIGPTLAAKDKTNSVRFDTFGDVFEESDCEGEDVDAENVDPVLESPAPIIRGGIRGPMEGQGAMDDAAIHAQAQAATLDSPPALGTDTGDAPSPTSPPEPVTPKRVRVPASPQMAWPLLPPGARQRTMVPVEKNPNRTGPSRRPANHAELPADHKKETPVWHLPGHDAAAGDRPSQYVHQRSRLRRGPSTMLDFGNRDLASVIRQNERAAAEAEDMILVDMADDGEDVSYYSPDSNREDTPPPPSRDRSTISYSSVEPTVPPAREKEMTGTGAKDFYRQPLRPSMRPQGGGPDEDDEEGYYHVPTPLSQTGARHYNAALVGEEQEQEQRRARNPPPGPPWPLVRGPVTLASSGGGASRESSGLWLGRWISREPTPPRRVPGCMT